ncbi:MAG TPA: SusC/RagA family TonB-linked outer membrane protein [Gemmatimonas aurantiaca]|uniref:SusC/RagA family TonB-linked outer membrane protein n=2 Tax=Gemmatimonas aurantiaca TaxID=173480 RepID=A0A3D4V8E4_9BACT|nr:SusC/RagA family TonB-linked outer membrane protein [Gemmatimonas aurantiaca]BAH39121.1 putative outer membrane protein [Gemmatimonas aurantiaca T-27]HCT57419.1 SusC/RagA family TonB-linked outer membrane protein [Gemmatimonas aurantiaca]
MLHSWRPVLALAGLLALAGAPAQAQQSSVGSLSVTVTDAANQRPVEAARVFVVGTSFGGQTSTEGKLALRNLPAGEHTIRVLRVGYTELSRRVTIAAGQVATVDVALATAAVNLAAVVTTATGEQRRVEIGNATANIDASKVTEAAAVSNVSDLLNSRAPGVQVTSGSQTGTGARIRVRGTNSVSLSNEPIWIIDGVRMTSDRGSFTTATGSGTTTGGNNPSRTGDLNPEEIESIEIVKGPSAATLYGTDAANGVILVTTKKGRAGAPRWTIYGENGTVFDKNWYPTAYSLWGKRTGQTVSARDFCNLQRVGLGQCSVDSVSTLNIFDEKDLTPVGTGNRRQIGLQVAGGSESVRYFMSGEDELEVGVLELPEFERNRMNAEGSKIYRWTDRPNQLGKRSLRSNVNATFSPKLDIGMTGSFMNINQRYSLESNATAGLGSHVFGGPGTRNNGTVSGLPGVPLNGYRGWTPGLMWQELTAQEVNRFIWSSQANYRPTSWLSTRATIGNDWSGENNENLLRRGEGPPLSATTRLGARGLVRRQINTLSADVGATAQYGFLGFQQKTTVGAQYIGYKNTRANTGSQQLAPGGITVDAGKILTVSEATTDQRTFGAFIEQSLAWQDRLFLTAAVRSDQNSAFGTNFQSILYPKASMSYLVSEEDWWKAPSFVNSMRLRYAYGQSGVQPGPNDAPRYYSAGTTNLNGVDEPIIEQAALGNPDLKPERSAEHEMGFEAQLFGSRVTFDYTYYSKITTDALIQAVLPPSYGTVANQYRNLGSVKNAGMELGITAQLVQKNALGWDINLAVAGNDNKVVSLGNTPPQIGTSSRTVAGYPVQGLWAAPITGWEDKNGDGLLTYYADAARNEVFVANDTIFRGYATPRYNTTLTNGIDLFNRKLRLQTMLDWRSGSRWYNNTERIRCTRPNCNGRLNTGASFEEQAMNIAANEHSQRTLDGFFQPGSFVRLREASAQYTFSPEVTRKLIRGRSLSLILTARNLALWTKYRGSDPESGFNTTATNNASDAPSEFQTIAPPSFFIMRVNIGY